MSAMSIHWAGLARVAEISLVFGVGIIVVFALGVVGMSRLEQARSGEGNSSSRVSGYALAGTAFALCAAAVLYGLYLIIPQLHHG